jgi:hypothetical protein
MKDEIKYEMVIYWSEEGIVGDQTIVEESSTDTNTSTTDNISTEEKTGIPAPGLFISLLILLIAVQFIRKKQ